MHILIPIAAALQSATASTAPPIVPAAPVSSGAQARADRFARYVTATAPLTDLPGWTADLLESGDMAAIRVRSGGDEKLYPLDTVANALMMLSDRRVEGLWSAIVRWGGPGAGLEGLRDRNIAKARQVVASGGTRQATVVTASTVRPPIRAAILLADALTAAGRWDEANAVLLAARGSAPGKRDWDQVEWSALTVRLAGYYRRSEGVDAALALLDAGTAQLGRANPYSLNMDITRAAILTEAGRHGPALDAIISAENAFSQQGDGKPGEGKEKVPGSDRQFAWIKACALHGLSRGTEASAAEALLLTAGEPRDADLIISNNIALRYRYARCLRNVPLAERELVDDFEHRLAGGMIFLVMQPASRLVLPEEAAFAQTLSVSPILSSATAARFRPLPPQFEAALNDWRAASAIPIRPSGSPPAPAPRTPSPPSRPRR